MASVETRRCQVEQPDLVVHIVDSDIGLRPDNLPEDEYWGCMHQHQIQADEAVGQHTEDSVGMPLADKLKMYKNE